MNSRLIDTSPISIVIGLSVFVLSFFIIKYMIEPRDEDDETYFTQQIDKVYSESVLLSCISQLGLLLMNIGKNLTRILKT